MKCLAFKESGNAPTQGGRPLQESTVIPGCPQEFLLIPCSIHGCSQAYFRELPSGETAVNEDLWVLFAYIMKIMHCTEVLCLSLWALKPLSVEDVPKMLKEVFKNWERREQPGQKEKAQALFSLERMAFSWAMICFLPPAICLFHLSRLRSRINQPLFWMRGLKCANQWLGSCWAVLGVPVSAEHWG